MVPNFPPSDPRFGRATLEGGSGIYNVTFILSVPGKNVFREDVNSAHPDGDSLVMFPEKVEQLEINVLHHGSRTDAITLGRNSAGRLSTASIEVNATSLIEAEKYAFDVITALLSVLSFTCDVGIEIGGYEVLEQNTGTLKVVYGMVGKIKMIFVPEGFDNFVSDERNRRLLAAYREGMSATNVFYQALSFWKVIEGCAKLQSKGTFEKKASKPGRDSTLRLPKNLADLRISDELQFEKFQPFLGKKFTWISDHFRPVIRNAIAHLDPDQHVLDIDRFEDVHACEKAVPVLRYMARCLLESTFSLTVQFPP
jgi:hypothetical protein